MVRAASNNFSRSVFTAAKPRSCLIYVQSINWHLYIPMLVISITLEMLVAKSFISKQVMSLIGFELVEPLRPIFCTLIGKVMCNFHYQVQIAHCQFELGSVTYMNMI